MCAPRATKSKQGDFVTMQNASMERLMNSIIYLVGLVVVVLAVLGFLGIR